MDVNEYQQLAARTMLDVSKCDPTPQQLALVVNSMGASGEAGELLDHIKKHLAILCHVLGWTMSDVMAANIRKLEQRYPNGFTPSNSINRKDVSEIDE
jgi:hypothetical protein